MTHFSSLKRRSISAAFVLFALSATFFFASCTPQTQTPETKQPPQTETPNQSPDTKIDSEEISIYGTWLGEWPGEEYIITSTTFESKGCYAGDNLTIAFTSSDSGYIYIKYTRALAPSGTYTEDPSLAPDVGKWYCVSFTNLTATSVRISGAYNANGKSSCQTLEEAKTEFTIDNGYFAYYSDCIKVIN